MDLKLANELIPGYATLPKNLRAAFEATEAGNTLLQTVQQLENNLANSILSQLYRMIFKTPQNQSREECIQSAQAYVQYSLRSSKEYRTLVHQIHQIHKIRLKSIIQQWALKHVEHLYVDLFHSITKNHFKFMNLELFNTIQAKSLTLNKLSMDAWVEQYEAELLVHIKKNIGLINGKEPFPHPPVISRENVRDSLSRVYSYLCTVRNNQKEVKWCIDFIYERAADARVFFRATGFAQSGSAWLVGFDLVNYFRMAGHVAETRTILSKLIQPFTPIFNEYSSINREHNIINQILRTIIPMVILATSVILVSALLSSFVIPEIAFLFILFPTIYLGLIAASGYIVAKDFLYNGLCQLWYGGPFNIPVYQVNEKMITSFGNTEKARKVRDFYVDEIRACLEQEKRYQAQIGLNQADQDNRKINFELHTMLQMEWYDIHDNPACSTDTAVEIALNRLQIMGRKASNNCQTIQNEVEMEIPKFVHEIADKIKTSVIHKNHQSRQQPRFFTRPACLKHREELERLHTLKEEIGMCSL